MTWKFRNTNRGSPRPADHTYQLRIDVIPNDDENSGRSIHRAPTGLVGVHYTNESSVDLKFRVETKILNVSRQLDIKSVSQNVNLHYVTYPVIHQSEGKNHGIAKTFKEQRTLFKEQLDIRQY